MPVGTYALCSLDEVKEYYGMKGAHDAKDGLLESLIDSFTEMFETYCDREFLSRERTEYHDGNGTRHIFTDQYPITTISGIWSSTSWDWTDTTLVDSTTYTIRRDTSIILKASVFAKADNQNIRVIYTAGYANTAIPDDLNLACIEEVVRAYKNRKGVDVLAIVAPDGQVTRFEKDLMPTTLRVLNSYRKLRVI